MSNEFKGRFVNCYKGDKEAGRIESVTRISLNQVKVIGGTYMARLILTEKQFSLSNTRWYELELLPGEELKTIRKL